MVPNCDKNVPGMLMAAARINVPTVFVSGGPMLAGHVKGKKTSLSSMFEAVGAYTANKITAEELAEFENKACPSCGSCSGMYTANSMNCLTEQSVWDFRVTVQFLLFTQTESSLQSTPA